MQDKKNERFKLEPPRLDRPNLPGLRWTRGGAYSPDHEQYAADLRQQRQQDKPEHCEVIAGGL
ncbi:hypothetical protein SAMN05444169_6546 [Bradyrhizobium erythrophlei]|uniref:Uncharacterized protein n=1 Tax=Bradyrhizobium erythrophlei TaxID=1437360 RepID=A0A1M5RFQ8_9BRAD|nr:hypothetical protein SAMN05444169_6546 [Bradyrhizobium erythrophlei]